MAAQPNYSDGRDARDDGMDTVLGNTPEWWRENCYRLMAAQPADIVSPFTGEDFRAYAAPLIGEPHHSNAWGAIWYAGKRAGLILFTGQWRHMTLRRSHARKTQLYVWPARPWDSYDWTDSDLL